jgi:hypothetical protein
VRMQDLGKFLRRWTDATRRARRFLQRGVNGVVRGIARLLKRGIW